MADTFYHVSQVLFFALSAVFLGGMLYQNQQTTPLATARNPVRNPLPKRQSRR